MTARRQLEKFNDTHGSRILTLQRPVGAGLQDIYYQHYTVASGENQIARYEKAAKLHPEFATELRAMAVEVRGLIAAAKAERDAEKAAKAERAAARAAKAANITSNGVRLGKLSLKAFDTLSACLAPVRTECAVRAERYANEFVATVEKELAEHGGLVEKAFPTLSDRDQNAGVRNPKAQHRALCNHATYDGHGGRVAAVGTNAEAVRRYVAAARHAAQMEVDSYVIKLAGKIGKPVRDLTVTGSLWNNSTLSVVCEDGEAQCWVTRCIINCSCLGTLFNQWPTRRTA